MLLFWWHIFNDPDLSNVLLDEKLYKNIVIYQAANKAHYDIKPFDIIFDKVYGYVGKYHRTKHLPLFPPDEKHERPFDRTR